MNLKRQALILVVQSYQKSKEVPYMEVSRDIYAYKSSNFHFLKSLFNFHSQKSTRFFQLPAFYLVHPWPTTLQKPWTNRLATVYVDFGKSQDRFGRFSWSKNDSNYLDIKLKVFKREDKKAAIRLRQNLSMREADFNQFIRQRNQLVVAADTFLREENLSPVLQSTLCKDMEEQLKIVHKVIDVVDRSKRRICVTLLRYKVDNSDTS